MILNRWYSFVQIVVLLIFSCLSLTSAAAKFDDVVKSFNNSGSATIDVHLSDGNGKFAMQRWATQQGGFWNSQQWFTGDFNGDGFTDVAKAFNDYGYATVDVHLSDGNGKFIIQRWATQQGGFWDTQKWFTGDFNGDGFTDVAKAFNDYGYATIDVHLSDGNGKFTIQRWATQQGGFWDAQKWFAGDFNGDGFADVAKAFNDYNYATIDVHLSDGNSKFAMQRWTTQQGGFWNSQQWFTGDFNGDGLTDIVKVFNDYGYATIDVHLSDGNSKFTMQRWATQQGGFWDTQKWLVGNFDGSKPEKVTLTVSKMGQGNITGSGINCGNICQSDYSVDEVITLTASPDSAYQFIKWSGDCSGTGTTTTVVLNKSKACTAIFQQKPTASLIVTKAGSGLGVIQATGIDCGVDCSESYDVNTTINLQAEASGTSIFKGWSGDCSGTIPIVALTMNKSKSCIATFDEVANSYELIVSKMGTGRGTVRAKNTVETMFSLKCDATCTTSSNFYPVNSKVALSAQASGGSQFIGWSGCRDKTTPSITVTMDSEKNCVAIFSLINP